VHPRTRKILEKLNLNFENLHYINPLGYLEFNYLVKHALAVLTDSGGITEETTVMNVPCITLRENTERPETCEMGSNVLVGNDTDKIAEAFRVLFLGQWKQSKIPELWDGKAANRIVDNLIEIYKL
jgi:UDP-N-acetylglucosamine 2-epimerase (non-hydrolysing)